MGATADQIDREIKETRDQIDENLGVLERRAASNVARYGKIAAGVVGVAAVAIAGFLIYRRLNRPTRVEQLRRLVVEAVKDLPDSLKDLPDEVATRLKTARPSIKVLVNTENQAKEPGTLESIARRVAPAVVGTASSAVIGRLRRSPEPEDAHVAATAPAYD